MLAIKDIQKGAFFLIPNVKPITRKMYATNIWLKLLKNAISILTLSHVAKKLVQLRQLLKMVIKMNKYKLWTDADQTHLRNMSGSQV